MGTYYNTRWTAFVQYLAETKRTGGVYNATAVSTEMIAFGQEWSNGTWGTAKDETWGTKGNTWHVAEKALPKTVVRVLRKEGSCLRLSGLVVVC